MTIAGFDGLCYSESTKGGFHPFLILTNNNGILFFMFTSETAGGPGGSPVFEGEYSCLRHGRLVYSGHLRWRISAHSEL